MSDEPARLAAIRGRCEAAAEGPWEVIKDVGEDGRGRPNGRDHWWVAFAPVPTPGGGMGRGDSTWMNKDTAEFVATGREDVPWLCDQLLSAWGLLQVMAQDSDAYHRGVAEGLRLAAEAVAKERARRRGGENPKEYIEQIAALGPAASPLPPDALLREWERMRAALRKVIEVGDAYDGDSQSGTPHEMTVIAREALGEQP